MDFINLMGAASKLMLDGKITSTEWATINEIAVAHDWE
jgi:hypothetical protein